MPGIKTRTHVRSEAAALAARHPRAVVFAVTLAAFVALQGAAGAETISGDTLTSPNNGHSTGSGP